ncbi:MAG: DUF4271 domain-containing protein [Paludibacteraceae bacterium]|nr:DUF4271 domain-containing protein [Paludibacteraceae bacterium]
MSIVADSTILSQTANTHLDDSLINVVRDSLGAIHRTDSVQIVVADSLRQVAKNLSGFVGTPLPQNVASETLTPILLLIIFLLYGYVFTRGRKMMLETIKDFFYLKERSSIFIDSSLRQNQLSFHFIFILVFSGALFLHVLLYKQACFLSFQNKIIYLGLFALLIMVFLAVKYFVFNVLSYIFFRNNNKASIFIRGYFTILFGLGLGLFPLSVGLIYTPPSFHLYFIIGGLILCIISFLLIFYKTSQIFLNKISSFFYIILYLCTLEILPIIIVLKALT